MPIGAASHESTAAFAIPATTPVFKKKLPGGTPSYVEVLTSLQMANDADDLPKNLRQ